MGPQEELAAECVRRFIHRSGLQFVTQAIFDDAKQSLQLRERANLARLMRYTRADYERVLLRREAADEQAAFDLERLHSFYTASVCSSLDEAWADGLKRMSRTILNHLNVIESLSFEHVIPSESCDTTTSPSFKP